MSDYLEMLVFVKNTAVPKIGISECRAPLRLSDIASNEVPLISTKIHNYGCPNAKYFLMAIDCDTVECLTYAVANLEFRELKYYIIESSPNKFWVITNLIGHQSEVANTLSYIPGCDPNYAKLSMEKGQSVLRAVPKNGFIPIFPTDIVGDGLWLRWLRLFQSWWQEPAIYELAERQGLNTTSCTFFSREVKRKPPRLLRPSVEEQYAV
jgi:hypothetical protein